MHPPNNHHIEIPSQIPREVNEDLRDAMSQHQLGTRDAIELVQRGPAVATGFAGTSDDPSMLDTFVQRKITDAFSTVTLWEARIGFIRKNPIYLLLLSGLPLAKIEQVEQSGLITRHLDSNLFLAADKERYLQAAMFLEDRQSLDAVTHRYKVRALNQSSSPFSAIELYSFGVEKTSDYDYLQTLPLSDEDRMRVYILGTIAHEVGHKILRKHFGPSGVGTSCDWSDLSRTQQEALTGYMTIVEEERSDVREKYVSEYALSHQKNHLSFPVLTAHEDGVESIRIFLTNPQYLQRYYPRRFAYLQNTVPTLNPGALSEVTDLKPTIETTFSTDERGIQRVALATVNQMDSGINAIAAQLKNVRIEVLKLMLYEDCRHKDGWGYSSKELETIIEKLREAKIDLLGISIFEYGASRAFALMHSVKEQLGIPVVLGGQHAMQYPEECFQAGADAVCLGEGESGFVPLLQSWNSRQERDQRNFVVKTEDLSRIPLLRERLITDAEFDQMIPDFSYEQYFTLRDEKLVPLSPDTIANPEHHQTDRAERTYIYASDRGCPLNCSFCYNSILRVKFREAAQEQGIEETNYLRRKSPAAIVRDLEIAKEKNPWVEFLNLMNDDTAAHSAEELREFSRLYRERIGWPFYCMASPQKLCPGGVQDKERGIDEGRQKVQALIHAGLVQLNMGIQTNEITSKKLYNRPQSEALVLTVTDMLHDFAQEDLNEKTSGKVDLFFDFIIHNPLETHEDVLRTVTMLKKIKPPFDLVSHSLYIGKRSTMRGWYEEDKKRRIEQGLPYNRALEDLVGESDFHDTHKFFDLLKDNETFYINSVIEFMAGRHDVTRTGRIPRHAADLLSLDVFSQLLGEYPVLKTIVASEMETGVNLSVDLLTAPPIVDFFQGNQPALRMFFTEMHLKHPIHYSNER